MARPHNMSWRIYSCSPYHDLREENCLSHKKFYVQNISSGARKNNVNAMPRFAGNSSFFQAHAFKSGYLLQPTANISFVCFISRIFYTKLDFAFKYHIVQFYLLKEYLNCGSFIVHIVSFPARRTRSRRSSRHPTIWRVVHNLSPFWLLPSGDC